MLFNKEIEGLHDDDFEGSVDEHRIFTEVFLGNDSGRSSERCLVTGVINFESDYSKHTDVSLCSNSENSAITIQENSYNVKEDSRENSGLGCFLEENNLLTRQYPEMNAKRMKLSSDKLSKANPSLKKVPSSSAPSSGVVSGMPSSHSVYHIKCHFVESSSQGITSGCYLLKRHLEMDRGDDVGDRDASNCRLSSLDESERKEVVASKAIANLSVTDANKSGSLRCANPRWNKSCFVELDITKMSVPRDSTTDPRPLLRYHINRLLMAMGWVVGKRKRANKNNGIGEYIYRSPEGRPIREFSRVWNLCGQSLFADANNVVQESDGKQWANLTQFFSDLSNTLTEIKELDNLGTTTTFSHRWYLLDPFANVVFIEKTIGSLKAGKVVKATRSFMIDSYSKGDAVLALRNVDGIGHQFAEIHVTDQPSGSSLVSVDAVSVTRTQFREISRNERSSLDPRSLPACGSDSTCDQTSTSLFEVPICSENANILFEGSESLSPHHDSNTSSPNCDKYRSNHAKDMPLKLIKDVSMSSSEDGKYFDGKVVQECFVANVRSESCKKSHICSSQHWNEEKQSRCKKFHPNSASSKKLGLVNYDGKDSRELTFATSTDEAPLNVKSKLLDSQTWRHDINSKKNEDGQKKSITCQLKDDDLLISAIIKNRSFRSTLKSSVKKVPYKSKTLRKCKSQKGSCRLLPRSLNKGGKHCMDGKWFALGTRTVLSWLIHSGVISLNEVIQYRNPKDDAVVKDGLITLDGILCRCCDKVFSVSEFKSHAGFRLNRPCLNLFMESGKPFTLCQLEAWSAEYKARKSITRTVQVDSIDQNDDSCGLCGEGGELICCDNCPSTFHQACLHAQELPEGSWYCSQCTCRICGDLVDDKDALKSPGALKCSQCEHNYHEACLEEKDIKRGVASDTWFCGDGCQEVYSGLHSCIGLMNRNSDGFSWTILRCIHGDQKVHSAQRFVALKAECNSKLAVALTIMEECFLPMVDQRTGIDMIPHVFYSWGSQFARLNYHGFRTLVLEKDDVLMSVASVRIHGVKVAEMPLIATCSKYRRQGMCRRLMNAIEEMLKSFKVEKLVISAIPSLVETWTTGFGFKLLEDNERESLSNINLMVFPGTIWLKKPLYQIQSAGQQMGLCYESPSGTDDPTETGARLEGGPTVQKQKEVYDDRQLPLNEESQKTNVLEGNDK